MSLLTGTDLTANFQPGSSALGHHWELVDGTETPVGDTKREYSGGALKRGMWRAVTATGMDKENDIRAVVRDVDENPVVRLFSRNDAKDRRVEVTDPEGAPVGVAHRVPGEGFTFKDAAGTVVATIGIAKDQQDPWELHDAAGEQIGVVTRQKAKRIIGLDISDWILGFESQTQPAADFQNTMHLGFAFSHTYSVALTSEPPHPLVALTPVLLGYAY